MHHTSTSQAFGVTQVTSPPTVSLALTIHERAAIHQGRWFRDLPAATQQALLEHARLRVLLAGEPLCRHGIARDDWFAVCRGQVRLNGVFVNGKVFTLSFLRAGDWFGQLSSVDDMPQMVDAVAQTDCTVLSIRAESMKRLVSEHPCLLEALLRMSYARLRELARVVEELHTLPLEARLARKIMQLAQRENSDPTLAVLRLSQQDWADLLGASRPRVNSHLKSLQRDGILHLEHRCLAVLDAARLSQIAQLEPVRRYAMAS
jgi:CRP-like cAMP-binding protein